MNYGNTGIKKWAFSLSKMISKRKEKSRILTNNRKSEKKLNENE